MSISAELDQEIRKLGGIARLTDVFLVENNLVRILGDDGSNRLFTLSELVRLQAEARTIIGDYSGYLCDSNHYILERFIGNDGYVSPVELKAISGLAASLKDAGLPAIYRPDRRVYTTRVSGQRVIKGCFPAVDHFIQFAVGLLVGVSSHLFATDIQKKDVKYIIKPTPLGWFQIFLQTAFTADKKIDPILVQEWLYYLSIYLQNQNEEAFGRIIARDMEMIVYLESVLGSLSTAPVYKKSKLDPTVVKNYTWYLSYSPEVRLQIVEAYFASFKGKKPGVANRPVFERVMKLFPEVFNSVWSDLAAQASRQEKINLRQRVEQLVEKDCLKGIPIEVFSGEEWLYLRERLLLVFRKLCEAVPANHMFAGYDMMVGRTGVPRAVFNIPEYRATVLEIMCVRLQELPDSDFNRIFVCDGKLNHKANRLGGDTIGPERLVARFKEMVRSRYGEIASITATPVVASEKKPKRSNKQ
jgi:hypothetical protein